MGYEIANAWITVKPSFDGFTQEVKDQLASVEKMSSGFGSKISSGIGKTLKVGFAGAGAAAGGVLATSIAKGMGRLGALDQAQAKLEALGNSTKDVQGIMDNALASVKGTAFGIGEAAGTAATMVASGIEPGQELETVLKGVADSAAIAGVGMDEMGLIWGKVAAKGKLDGETLAQMLERQIPIYDILAEKTGHTSEEIADMVSKGKIDFQTFSEAMNDYVGGGAKRMGDTFKGSLDNMGAAMGRFGAALVGPAFAGAPAIFGAITDVFDGMNDAISPAATQIGEILTPAIENVAGKISSDLAPAIADGTGKLGELAVKVTEAAVNPDTWARLADVFGQLRDTAANLWPTFENLLTVAFDLSQSISTATWTALIGVLNALAPVLNTVVIPLLEKVSEVAKENPALVQGMVTAFVGLKVVSGLIGPVTSFVGVLKNVGGAAKFAKGLLGAGGMSGALAQLMAGAASANPIVAAIGSKVSSVVFALTKATPVLNIFKTIVTTAFSGALKVFDLFATGVAKVISLFANGLVKGVQLAVGAFKLLGAAIAANPIGAIIVGITALVAGFTWFFTQTEIGRELWANFTSFIGEQWEVLKALLAAGWEFIKVNVLDAWNTATTTLSAGWDVFVALISGAWETIKNAFNIGWQFIRTTVIDAWNSTVNTMSNAWQIVTTAIGAAWDFVSARLSAVWGTIKAAVINAFNTAAQNMRNIWQTVTTAMSSAWNAFKDKVSQLVETIKNRLTNMVDTFKQIPGKIKSAFAGAGSWLLDAGRSIIQGLANGIRNAVGVIENAIRAVVPDNLERFVPGLALGGIVPAFARGGLLPTTGPGTDTVDGILGINDKGVAVARVNAGEFIVNAEATKKNLPLLAAINGGAFDNRKGDLGLPAYADGGVVSAKQLLAFAHGESVNGYRAARSLEGAPYSFGGFNWGDCSSAMGMLAQFAGGQNPLGGRYMATGDAMIKLPRARFSRGTSSGKNAFEVGFFNGGPYGGHTSGTIYDANGKATNVEMGGGRGNGQIGGPAAGSRHSQYTDRYYINLVGSAVDSLTDASGAITDVISTSTSGMTVSTPEKDNLTIDWGDVSSLASEWDKRNARNKKLMRFAGGLYDGGGVLPNNGVAVNFSGKPEAILSQRDMASWSNIGRQLEKLNIKLDKNTEQQLRVGEAIVKNAGTGGNMRAYMGSLDLAGGFDLASQVGDLTGINIKGTFGNVVSSWGDLEDASLAQVDASDALKQAEDNLTKARKDGDAKAVKQAEDDLAKARGVVEMAAAATGRAEIKMIFEVINVVWSLIDRIVESVNKTRIFTATALSDAMGNIREYTGLLADQRQLVSKLRLDLVESQLDQIKSAYELRSAQLNLANTQADGLIKVAEAEQNFLDLRSKGIATASTSVEALGLAVDRFRMSGIDAFSQVSLTGQMTGTELTNAITAFQQTGVLKIGEVEYTGTEAMAVIRDALSQIRETGVFTFDQIKTDTFDAVGLIDKAIEAFRDKGVWSFDSLLENVEVVTPEIEKSIWSLAAARLEGLAAEQEASVALLTAAYNQQVAALNTAKIQADLARASKQLAEMTGETFGMTEKESVVTAEVTKLLAENAKVMGERDKAGNSVKYGLGRVLDWDGDGKIFGKANNAWTQQRLAYDQQIAKNNEQIQKLLGLEDAKQFSAEQWAEIQDVLDKAALQYKLGDETAAKALIDGSLLGDAARAKEFTGVQKELNSIDEAVDSLNHTIKELELTVPYELQRLDMDSRVAGYQNLAKAAEARANAYGAESVRAAQAYTNQAIAAEKAGRELLNNKPNTEVVIQVPSGKSAFTADEVENTINAIDEKVDGVSVRLSFFERMKNGPLSIARNLRS